MRTPFHPPDSLQSIRIGLAFLLTGSVMVLSATVALHFHSMLNTRKQDRLDRIHQAILVRVDYLKTTHSFSDCITEAAQIPSESLFYSSAKTLQDQCQTALDETTFNQAQALAQAGQFPAAIVTLQTVSRQNATKVQKLTQEWSRRILQAAEGYYTSAHADLPKAIQLANSLTSDNPLYLEAQIKIRQWQAEWAINQQHWQAAQAALETSQPEAALLQVQKIKHPYWIQQSAPIMNAAYTKIALLAEANTVQFQHSQTEQTSQPDGEQLQVTVTEVNKIRAPSNLLLPITALAALMLLGYRPS